MSGAQTLPAALYRPDPARWRREQAQIFRRSWQFAGHEGQLPAPGDLLGLEIAGHPVLIVRDEAGELRAFHNVCRHRAGPLAPDGPSRCAGELVCRYHGWRYALDGRLRAARDFGRAEGFDPRAMGLFPVRLERFQSLVFVALSEAAPPFAAAFGPVLERLRGRDWSGLRPALERRHAIGCDWKTYVENYLEGYHVAPVHPGLDAEIDSGRYAVEVRDRIVFHHAPARVADAVYEGLWAFAWPNTGFNVYGEGLMMERMNPTGPGGVRLDYLYLTPGGDPPPSETLALSDAVLAEDRDIVEAVQRNLDAGVYETGRLSPRHEAGVGAFQDWVRAALDGTGEPG